MYPSTEMLISVQKYKLQYRKIYPVTSSLAVGRFAAKKSSLRSPIGRLVASLVYMLQNLVTL